MPRGTAEMAALNVIPHPAPPADNLAAQGAPPSVAVHRIDEFHIFGHLLTKTTGLIQLDRKQKQQSYTEGVISILLCGNY